MIYYVLIFCFLAILFINHVNKRRNEPPGPLGLPIFGSMLSKLIAGASCGLIKIPSSIDIFRNFRQKYGEMWSMRMGSVRIITLASIDLINEAFVNNAELFSGRPKQDIYKLFNDFHGILFSDGESWKYNRQLALKSLRNLGMGKKTLENKIILEANYLIEYLKNKNGEPLFSANEFVKAISNVVCQLVFNMRNDYDDEQFECYVSNLQFIAHSNVGDNQISICPNLFRRKAFRKHFVNVDKFFNSFYSCIDFIKIKCYENSKYLLQKPRDVPAECVLEEFLRNYDSELTESNQDENNLEIVFSMFDLFNAGIDTTNNALSFCCLMLGKYPKLQEELRDEINEVVEHNYDDITMDKRRFCVKLLSFIDEVFRYCVLVPKMHHRVLRPTIFNNYELLPTDIIMGDISTAFRDEKLFEKPYDFNPKRFLDTSQMKYIPNKHIITFGCGKRSCIGEGIANMELFIILTKILVNFDIELTKETLDNFEAIIDGNVAIVHAPLEHFIILKSLQ